MGIVGALLGDIAGSQYEFSRLRPDNLDWKHCELFTKQCRATDDSVMSIACKMAILENKINPNFEKWYRNLGLKYPRVGYGGMFKQWINDPSTGAYGSFGNGSAMRVSAVTEFAKTKEEVTDWFNIEVWDKQAEFAGEYIKKGRQVVVDGRISISKWTDQTGEEKERFLIIANNVRLLGSKRDAEA